MNEPLLSTSKVRLIYEDMIIHCHSVGGFVGIDVRKEGKEYQAFLITREGLEWRTGVVGWIFLGKSRS